MKTSLFSRSIVLLLLVLLTLITVSCKKKISKEDLKYQVGQAISEYYFEEVVKQFGSLVTRERIGELARIETKVSLIKETENRYIGDAVVEYWVPDQNGGDGPGRKESDERVSVTVTVDADGGSFRWEIR